MVLGNNTGTSRWEDATKEHKEESESYERSDLLDISREEEVQLSNTYCEACGYISADFVEAGLHLIECEKLNNEENHENYKCTKGKDSTDIE